MPTDRDPPRQSQTQHTPPPRTPPPPPEPPRHPAQGPPATPGVREPDQQHQAERDKAEKDEAEKAKAEEKVLEKEEAAALFRAGHRLKKKGDPAEKWFAASRVHGTLCICKPVDEEIEKTMLAEELVLVE